jgi:hypothetical protein
VRAFVEKRRTDSDFNRASPKKKNRKQTPCVLEGKHEPREHAGKREREMRETRESDVVCFLFFSVFTVCFQFLSFVITPHRRSVPHSRDRPSAVRPLCKRFVRCVFVLCDRSFLLIDPRAVFTSPSRGGAMMMTVKR